MFKFFKKTPKEDKQMATVDEKDIKKANEDEAVKGENSQTERALTDESVAAQFKEEGKEDSQPAKDRIDESKGAEKAAVDARLDKMETMLGQIMEFISKGQPSVDKEALEKAKEKYGVSGGVFESETATEKMTPAEATAILRQIKG